MSTTATTRPRAHHRDGGFTLPELLITIMISSTIMAVMASAVAVTLRTVPDTEARADSAVILAGLVAWLPQDVDSTSPGGFDVNPTRPSGCGTDPGRNVLHLSWHETIAGSTTRYTSNYRAVDQGDGTARLARVTCTDRPHSTRWSWVSGSIPALPPTWTPGAPPVAVTVVDRDGDGRSDGITMAVTTIAGTVVHLDAVTKDPATTLPPRVAPETPTTSTTTSTTTTTVPPTTVPDDPGDPNDPADPATTTTTTTTTTTVPPCEVTGMTVTPSTVALKNRSQARLERDVVIEVTLGGGYCVGLTVRYESGGPGALYVQNVPPTSPHRVVLLGHPNGNELWTVGDHVIDLVDGTPIDDAGTLRLLASRVLRVVDP